jgi:hypothetical protein
MPSTVGNVTESDTKVHKVILRTFVSKSAAEVDLMVGNKEHL